MSIKLCFTNELDKRLATMVMAVALLPMHLHSYTASSVRKVTVADIDVQNVLFVTLYATYF